MDALRSISVLGVNFTGMALRILVVSLLTFVLVGCGLSSCGKDSEKANLIRALSQERLKNLFIYSVYCFNFSVMMFICKVYRRIK